MANEEAGKEEYYEIDKKEFGKRNSSLKIKTDIHKRGITSSCLCILGWPRVCPCVHDRECIGVVLKCRSY